MLNRFVKTLVILSVIVLTCNCSWASITTDAKLQYNSGIDYYNSGQYENAIDCFRQAINLDPNYVDAYYNLGSLLEYMQQNEEALNVFKQIILRKPDDYEAVYETAVLSNKIGEKQKALGYLALIPETDSMYSQAVSLANTINNDLLAEQNTPQTAQVADNVQPATTAQPDNVQAQSVPQSTEVQSQQTAQDVKSFVTSNVAANSDGSYDAISSPTGITTDINGNVYIASFSDNTIYKITPDNKKLVYIKSQKIDGPIGLTLDSSNNLYVANYNKNNVLKISEDGGITIFADNVANPYCMYVVDDILFVSSQGKNMVLRYKLK